jgi:RHS repeat-associated protein
LLTQGTSVYTWDAANRLVSADVGGVVSTFAYNGLGQRTSQTVGGVTTEYVLDVATGLPEVIVATTGGASTYYVQIQGQILAQYGSGAWAYALPDHLGSVRQLTNAGGQVTLAQSYDPFGNLFEAAGSGASGFGYTGELWDVGTELVFLRARYYDPGSSRFISKDIFPGHPDSPQSLNGWSYVGNNSLKYTDPSGLIYVEGWGYTCDDPAVVDGMGPDGKRCVAAPPGATLETLALCSPIHPGDESWKSRPQCNYNPSAAMATDFVDSNPLLSEAVPPSPCNKCDHRTRRTGINGYSEGSMSSVTFLLKPIILKGIEVVFDFATLELAEFTVHSEIDSSALDISADPRTTSARDISLIAWNRIYDVSYISGFKPDPGGSVLKQYVPHTVNYAGGVGGGPIASLQIGGHWWLADNLSGLNGKGFWYAGGLSLSVGFSVEFSMQKTYTTNYFYDDLGDVDNPEDAHRFMQVLETWAYPLNYAGLRPFRTDAVETFKEYACID